MVNVVQTVSTGASSAAQFARAAAATAVLSTAAPANEAVAAQPADQVVVPVEQAYRYNSFEFSYRQDFGKIVLLRQKPDTGEVVQQFPSEYYLRKYADGQRVARSAANEGTGAKPSADAPKVAQTSAGLNPSPDVAPAPAPAPSIPAAPALPSAGAGGTTNAVDLTV